MVVVTKLSAFLLYLRKTNYKLYDTVFLELYVQNRTVEFTRFEAMNQTLCMEQCVHELGVPLQSRTFKEHF